MLRRLLLITGVALAALAAGGCHDDGDDTTVGVAAARETKQQQRWDFVSRPDLSPPKLEIRKRAGETGDGYLILGPKKQGEPGGPMIVDESGDVVWFHNVSPRQAADVRVQTYKGKPVITWWEGTQPTIGIGHGTFVVVDQSYRQIAQVVAGNGREGDLHEFVITPDDTALILAYTPVPHDLTAVGGPKDGWVWDGVVQEIDIEKGDVLFEWRSLDHVPVTESAIRQPAKTASEKQPFDYFHPNSVNLDTDGNLIVSARNTSAIYKIDRKTGRVIWRLGGRASDFKMGPGTKFGFQHDAQRQADGSIRLFDNSAAPAIAKNSRALVIRIDEERMTATRAREYVHPDRLLAPHQGNAQRLPNGNLVVGWGGQPFVSEFSREGTVLFDAKLPVGDTYRAYRAPWEARPMEKPQAAARLGARGVVTVYASWNGATGIEEWAVLAGPDAENLREVTRAPRTGFETAIRIDDTEPYIAVRALGADGEELSTSDIVGVEAVVAGGA